MRAWSFPGLPVLSCRCQDQIKSHASATAWNHNGNLVTVWGAWSCYGGQGPRWRSEIQKVVKPSRTWAMGLCVSITGTRGRVRTQLGLPTESQQPLYCGMPGCSW